MASFGHIVKKLSSDVFQIEWFQDCKAPYGGCSVLDKRKKTTKANAKRFAKKHNLEWQWD